MRYFSGLLVLLAGAAYGSSLVPRFSPVKVSTFAYDGLKGPLNWYGLNKTANIACSTGQHQSPIVIDSTIPVVNGSSFNWTVVDYPNGTEFENLGTNVEVVVNGTLVDSISNTSYKLAQFHFHTPAEHRLNDEFYPMEMHWVFQSATKQYAVIGFMVELCAGPSCGEPILESIFSSVANISTPGQAVMTGPLAFSALIQKFASNKAWRYTGSLTTPPCSENVDWAVSTQLLYIELPTWLAVKKVIKFNARYTQDKLGSVNLLQNAANELANSSSQMARLL